MPVAEASSFLAPIEQPKRLILRIMYWYSQRQWTKFPRPFSVFVAADADGVRELLRQGVKTRQEAHSPRGDRDVDQGAGRQPQHVYVVRRWPTLVRDRSARRSSRSSTRWTSTGPALCSTTGSAPHWTSPPS